MSIQLSSESQVRQFKVSNALASARIKGVIPTKQLENNLADYVLGKKHSRITRGNKTKICHKVTSIWLPASPSVSVSENKKSVKNI